LNNRFHDAGRIAARNLLQLRGCGTQDMTFISLKVSGENGQLVKKLRAFLAFFRTFAENNALS